MHRIVAFTSIAVAAACSVACGGRGGSEAHSTASVTSASVDDARPLDQRLASALCEHEVECGRPQARACIDNTRVRVSSELDSWDCDPATRRASTEQCLSALRAESCNVDLVLRSNVCPLNVACRNASTSSADSSRLVSPGRALADIWRP